MTDEGRSSLGPLLVVMTLFAAPYVLFNSFTGMPWFDDEGTLMAGLRSLLDGHRMYDDIYSLYGPLYTEVYGSIYGLLRIPLTHTAGRFIAAAFWLAYTAGLAAFCYRLTRWVAPTAFSYLLILISLTDLRDSPGHPEELCLLLLAATLLLTCTIESTRNTAVLFALGAAVAGLALVKINIGIFVGGGLALGLLHCTTRGFATRIAIPLIAGALLLLPFALMALLWDFDWVKAYSLFSVLVIGAALLAFLAIPQQTILRWTDWWIMAAGASLTALVVAGGMMLMGSSAEAILGAVVLQNAHFVRNWYIPFQPGRLGLLAASASFMVALAYHLSTSRPLMHSYRDRTIAVLRLVFVLLGAALFRMPVLQLQILVPFCWLLMAQPAGTSSRHAVSRGVAGLIGAVMSLYAFPVAGHQVSIAALVPTMIVPVLACDLLQTLRYNATDAQFLTPARFAWLLMAGVIGLGTAATSRSARAYFSLVPLGLVGTSLIRETEERVQELKWITAHLSDCTSSYSVPGMWSFSFWTGQALLTSQNINDVLAFIQPAQQQAIVQVLSRQANLCVVYSPLYLRRFDRGQIQADPPLLRYLDSGFETMAERGDFVILRQRRSIAEQGKP